MNNFLTSLISVFSIAALAVFISAIRISYDIEKTTKPKARFPRYTNVFATTCGMGVDASDAATMALVTKLRWRILIVGLLFLPLIIIAYGLNS